MNAPLDRTDFNFGVNSVMCEHSLKPLFTVLANRCLLLYIPEEEERFLRECVLCETDTVCRLLSSDQSVSIMLLLQ